MKPDKSALAAAVDRRRARREGMLRYRYKEGFDRIGIVLFVLFALSFALIWLFVNEPFALPAEGTPQAAAIANELETACRDDLERALVMLCHERILGGYRWDFYSERLALGANRWLYGGLLLLVVVGTAWPVGRWVVRGFRKGREAVSGT